MSRFLQITRKLDKFTSLKRYFSVKGDLIRIDSVVKDALSKNGPVLALESTIITHGMPFPDNLKMALSVEELVRQNGVTPATIGVIDGIVHVGMSKDDLKKLATHAMPVKLSRRDLSVACSNQLTGGTTVSATMLLAHQCGIDIFATGGIGGVHKGGEQSMDVSADLRELGRTPITVVSAGVKSILDIGRTLEYLETEGVTVATFGNTNDFPAFFTRKSGFKSPYFLTGITESAQLIQSHQNLKLGSGVLIAVPIPQEFEASGTMIENAIKQAQEDARDNNIHGKEVTPFILKRVNDITKGESLKSNIALMKNNAAIGAQIAKELKSPSFNKLNNKRKPIKRSNQPVVIGGCNVDIISKATQDLVHGGPSNPAVVQQSFGGVGRNIAETLWKLNDDPKLISALGSDYVADLLLSHLKGMDTSAISILQGHRTGVYNAVFNHNGEVDVAVEDSDIHMQINANMIEQHVDSIIKSPLVCMDTNVSDDALQFVSKLCLDHNTPLLLEPTGELKAANGYKAAGGSANAITYITPNIDELKTIYQEVTSLQALTVDLETDPQKSLSSLVQMCRPLLERTKCISVTLGRFGVLLAVAQAPHPQFTHFCLTPSPSWDWLTHPISNVSGSGDGFAGGLAHGLLHGHDIHDAVQIGITIAQRALRSSEAVNQNLTENDAKVQKNSWPAHLINV